MTLKEISKTYEESVELLRDRIKELRLELVTLTDPDDVFIMKQRISQLSAMRSQCSELKKITAHYYDRGVWRGNKYTI